MNSQENTTICARATAAGRGAIAIIRISGSQTAEVIAHTFTPANRKISVDSLPVGKTMFGTIKNAEGEIIDEVIAVFFRSPHSYTGEDSAEIYCHGSQFIVSEILRQLMENGAKLAGAGEFTQRAFLNGKMDLAQAEAVADLIDSETKAARDIAMNQMRGGYSGELREMRSELLELVSLMELELDFSEEDVEFADRSRLSELLERVQKHISSLTDSFKFGNAIKNGIPVAIIGAVNTGKSTLLNALLKEERAIVSDIEGTTRDTVEDTMNIGGMTFRFIDTAGIRNTSETIEIIGIERTFTTISKAAVVLMVLDATRPEYFAESFASLAPRLKDGQQLYILPNKTDIVRTEGEGLVERLGQLASDAGLSPIAILPIAAKQGIGINELTSALTASCTDMSRNSGGGTLISNLRHYEALKDAQCALDRAHEGLTHRISTEFISQDIREALHYIGSITGEITTDEILGSIFGKFCIGK